MVTSYSIQTIHVNLIWWGSCRLQVELRFCGCTEYHYVHNPFISQSFLVINHEVKKTYQEIRTKPYNLYQAKQIIDLPNARKSTVKSPGQGDPIKENIRDIKADVMVISSFLAEENGGFNPKD